MRRERAERQGDRRKECLHAGTLGKICLQHPGLLLSTQQAVVPTAVTGRWQESFFSTVRLSKNAWKVWGPVRSDLDAIISSRLACVHSPTGICKANALFSLNYEVWIQKSLCSLFKVDSHQVAQDGLELCNPPASVPESWRVSAFPFHHSGPRNAAQLVELGSKNLYRLSHLSDPSETFKPNCQERFPVP